MIEVTRLESRLLNRRLGSNSAKFQCTEITKRPAVFTHWSALSRDDYDFLHSKIIAAALDFSLMTDFLSALEERVLVCDGAMGTMLYSKGIFISRSFDELNLSNPQLVREVHLDYIKAGVDIIETNTFGGNRTKLMSHGLAEHTRDINLQGARIAREAARRDVFVAGAIGPLGIRIEPWGKTSIDEAQAIFQEQAQA